MCRNAKEGSYFVAMFVPIFFSAVSCLQEKTHYVLYIYLLVEIREAEYKMKRHYVIHFHSYYYYWYVCLLKWAVLVDDCGANVSIYKVI